jgi:hypothetical protein
MSLVTGFFSLILFSYALIRNPLLRFEALLSINVSLLPIALFMPPGVVLYFLYRVLWKRSRLLRRERDMLQLPMRWFERKLLPQGATHEIIRLPDSSQYIMAKKSYAAEREMLVDRNRDILETSILKRKRGQAVESFVFGDYSKVNGTESIGKPKDPMADCVEIAGNPEELASRCNKQARWFAVLAVFFIITDIALNFVILFYILRDYFR